VYFVDVRVTILLVKLVIRLVLTIILIHLTKLFCCICKSIIFWCVIHKICKCCWLYFFKIF